MVMNSARAPEAAFTPARRIQPDEPVRLWLPSNPGSVHIYNGSEAYFVQAPPEAAELTVSCRPLTLPRGYDLLMLLRLGRTAPWATLAVR